MIVVVVALVLCGLAHDSANTGTRRAANQRTLQPAAEDRAKRRASSPADKSSLAGPNATLFRLLIVVVVIRTIVTVVVVATSRTVAHAIVVSAVVAVLLRKRRNNCGSKEERNEKNRSSKRSHLPLDAEFNLKRKTFSRKLVHHNLPAAINSTKPSIRPTLRI
jgi:Flp pilus assembly protein TadB